MILGVSGEVKYSCREYSEAHVIRPDLKYNTQKRPPPQIINSMQFLYYLGIKMNSSAK
jgi:hypothetical protein